MYLYITVLKTRHFYFFLVIRTYSDGFTTIWHAKCTHSLTHTFQQAVIYCTVKSPEIKETLVITHWWEWGSLKNFSFMCCLWVCTQCVEILVAQLFVFIYVYLKLRIQISSSEVAPLQLTAVITINQHSPTMVFWAGWYLECVLHFNKAAFMWSHSLWFEKKNKKT